MTSFPDTVAGSRSSGKLPEKPNFSQRCNLLSQLLKEKRSSGASTLGIGNKEGLQNSDGVLRLNASALDFLPQLVENPCIKKSNDRTPGPESPQLTIFYGGKMLVFDGFQPEKATQIMELATKLASVNPTIKETLPTAAENLTESKVPQTNTASQTPPPGNLAVGPDMRYPRRASLLKFLEKRKERVIAKGPYQINNPNPMHGEPEDQCLDLTL